VKTAMKLRLAGTGSNLGCSNFACDALSILQILSDGLNYVFKTKRIGFA
jgi:hypothetical protein